MANSTPEEAASVPEKAAAELMQTLRDDFAHEVADAMLMLDYLVANGVRASDGRTFDDNLIDIIKLAQDAIIKNEFPDAKLRAEFEKAYRSLSQFLAPVTARTLMATSRTPTGGGFWRCHASIAERWSWRLMIYTAIILIVAIAGSYLEFVHGPMTLQQKYDDLYRLHRWEGLQALLQLMVPFTYGALGACVYLLKSNHYYIYTRQFDPLRKPEYHNRLILGAIGGGMMVLLVDKIVGGGGAAEAIKSVADAANVAADAAKSVAPNAPDAANAVVAAAAKAAEKAKGTADGPIALSAKVLGFLAGYNTDLLFGAIERVSAALLPKIGLQSVQRAPQVAPTVSIDDVSLKDLLDRYHAATTDEARKLYEDLIKKLRDRI